MSNRSGRSRAFGQLVFASQSVEPADCWSCWLCGSPMLLTLDPCIRSPKLISCQGRFQYSYSMLTNRMHLAPENAVRPKHCGRAHIPRCQQEGARKRIGIWGPNLSAFAPFSLVDHFQDLSRFPLLFVMFLRF